MQIVLIKRIENYVNFSIINQTISFKQQFKLLIETVFVKRASNQFYLCNIHALFTKSDRLIINWQFTID